MKKDTANKMQQYQPNRTLAFTIRIVDRFVVTRAIVRPSAAAIIKPLPDVVLALTQSHATAFSNHRDVNSNSILKPNNLTRASGHAKTKAMTTYVP